ncbi:MAG: hypothetical protein ACRDFC_08435 [Ignavibacteria bacterium]
MSNYKLSFKTIVKILVVFSYTIFLRNNLIAQTDSLKVSEFNIYVMKSSKLTKIGWNRSIVTASNDSLAITDGKHVEIYPLPDVSKIAFKNGTYWVSGLLIGTLIGLAAGTAIYLFDDDDQSNTGQGHPYTITFPRTVAFILVIPGALLGTLFGALTPKYDEHIFTKLSRENKKTELMRSFKKYKIQ